MAMKLATWNINSARARCERILDVLKRHDLDILALQETKCSSAQFPRAQFTQAGYYVTAHGFDQWNGVAVISRYPQTNIRFSFPGQPGFTKGEARAGGFLPGEPEARALGVNVGGIDVWSLYVPNGRAVTDPHYFYKLAFLQALHGYMEERLGEDPKEQIALAGDWNIIPGDDDVWDPWEMPDGLYLTAQERDAFFSFQDLGFSEVSRGFVTGYTYWDYQRLRFAKNHGMRIDYVYASPSLAKKAIGAEIDRDERKGKGASDHVPVIVDFA